jgi:hypothetical protein
VINGVQDITDSVRDTWKDGVSVNGADFAALDQSDVFGDCPKDRLTNPRAWNPVRVDDRPTLSE